MKFFYLVADIFFTRCYANGKDEIICGHEIPMLITISAPLASEKNSHGGNEEWIQCAALWQQWPMNSVFTISFFPLKLKYLR